MDMDTTATPQGRALYWLIHDDPRMLEPHDLSLLQRHLLVSLHMQTTMMPTPDGTHGWFSCDRPHQDVNNGDEFCLSRHSVHDRTGAPACRWLSSSSECTWAGVSCDESNQIVSSQLCKFFQHLPLEWRAVWKTGKNGFCREFFASQISLRFARHCSASLFVCLF